VLFTVDTTGLFFVKVRAARMIWVIITTKMIIGPIMSPMLSLESIIVGRRNAQAENICQFRLALRRNPLRRRRIYRDPNGPAKNPG
jgi:hypothetical protein